MPTARAWLGLLLLTTATGAALAETPTRRPTDQERGEELYERHCFACHGSNGRGDGPATEALVVPVPDLTDNLDPRKREEQSRVVLRGKGTMPAFESTFDKADAKRVLKHLAGLLGQQDDEEIEEEGLGDEDEEVVDAPAPE